MFVKVTSQTTALRLFIAAAVVIIAEYIAIFYAPTEGGTGIYILSFVGTMLWLFGFCFIVMVITIIVSGIRSRERSRIGAMVMVAVILLLPLFPAVSTPQILRQHSTTLRTPNHVYQLAQDILPRCPDTFDANTYKCYDLVFLYQCDSLGVLCNIQAHDLYVYHDNPLRLQLVGNDIQIVGNDNSIIYKMPA